MKVQLQFNCPVGVIVDTETGEVDKVIVWDDHIDTANLVEAHRDEYVAQDHPDAQPVLAKMGEDIRDLYARYSNMGVSIFEPLAPDHPEVVKALAVARGNNEWPAWDFGC